MAGSEAEERIRSKVVSALRRLHPDARIIHELVIEQGGVRLDVAAVERDCLVVVEIKSERDVLKRLPEQVRVATSVAQCVWVAVAPRWADQVAAMAQDYVRKPLYGPPGDPRHGGWSNPEPHLVCKNPTFLPELAKCRLLGEAEDRLEVLRSEGRYSRPLAGQATGRFPTAMIKMLWADELRGILGAHRIATHGRMARDAAMAAMVESMTGGEIRRSVCAALRARPFARADDAIPWPSAASYVPRPQTLFRA